MPILLIEGSSQSHPFLRFMAATDRARHPSGSSDRRAAAACRPGGSATPEERWCRNASIGFAQYSWLPNVRHQSRAGSCCRRSALLHFGDGGTTSHSISVACGPVNDEGLPVAVVTLMRSSESHQMVFAPSACGNTRGPACEPGPCGRALNSSSLSCVRRTAGLRC